MLRPYQQNALQSCINSETGGCVIAPTGSGTSHINTGYGLSVSLVGKPDVGLTTLSEAVAVALYAVLHRPEASQHCRG